MADINTYRHTRWIRWIARIICVIFIVFELTVLIGGIISEYLTEGSVSWSMEGVTLLIIGAFALAGCILSWWQDLTAGILLVATSAGLGIHIVICAGRSHFLTWLIVGLPYFIAGLLLLYTWRLSKRRVQLLE